MAKRTKSDDDGDDKLADSILDDIACDRSRLSGFLDLLLAVDDPHIMAEPVARIADALTKQNHLRIDALKAKIKKAKIAADDEDDDFFEENGLPFTNEENDQN